MAIDNDKAKRLEELILQKEAAKDRELQAKHELRRLKDKQK